MTEPDATVDIDPDAGTMHVSLSPALQADVFADVLMADYPDDPVEGARNVWNLVAPSLRKQGWSDERIIEVYRIPDEVLSGEAERRARVRMGLQRLAWIEGEPGSMYRGEGVLLASLRAGGITEEDYAERVSSLAHQHVRRWPELDGIPPVPDSDLRMRTVDDGGETLQLVCDHIPTWRRWTLLASRRYLGDSRKALRSRVEAGVYVLARDGYALGEDVFTPETER